MNKINLSINMLKHKKIILNKEIKSIHDICRFQKSLFKIKAKIKLSK